MTALCHAQRIRSMMGRYQYDRQAGGEGLMSRFSEGRLWLSISFLERANSASRILRPKGRFGQWGGRTGMAGIWFHWVGLITIKITNEIGVRGFDTPRLWC